MRRVAFRPKFLGETVNVQFDFTSMLATGETISSPTVTASVRSGTDASPSGIVSGSASFSGAVVTQKITAGVVGVTYLLVCQATTSEGQTLRMAGLLTVIPEAP